MKTAFKCVFGFYLFAALAATLAYAETYSTQIKNVIVVIQENRTPDNLFQDSTLITAGADIQQPSTGGLCGTTSQPLGARPLDDCADPDHSHQPSWNNSYDGGAMDGACTVAITYGPSCSFQNNGFPCKQNSKGATDCTQYAYVSDPLIQPYWQIAENYGFANYFFQTNQGPSFPAHQLLFSGTSAPYADTNPYYSYFAAENTSTGAYDAGCIASSGSLVPLLNPSNIEITQVYPCFSHPTLATLLNNAGVPWRYYSGLAAGIWTAPNAISDICPENPGGSCGTTAWNSNVAPYLEGSSRYINGQNQPTLAPFLYDLQNCNFPTSGGGVYFVVPDGRWSDHALDNWGIGPDYVADIVNLVGKSTCSDPQPNWNNTAILIVWDDWGGWYDHISPSDPKYGPGIGYPNNTGGQYVYGFRVPFLVVSAYVKETNDNPGYISGTKQKPIIYDFGSILQFIENTYTISGDIDPGYHYADYFAGLRQPAADLSDFFLFCKTCARPFQSITLQYSNHCLSGRTGKYGCQATQCNSGGSECLCDVSCLINYPGPAKDPDTE